jgi:hypothetical protein
MARRTSSDYAPVTQSAAQWVAYRLMQDIFQYENNTSSEKIGRTRKEILDTYAECFEAISGKRKRRAKRKS